MLESNELKRPMYRAHLINNELLVEEVSPHIVARIGTSGLGHSKAGAIEKLKRRIMDKFAEELRAIDWQSMQYVKDFTDVF